MVFLGGKGRFFTLILFFLIAIEIFFISSIPGSKTPSSSIPFTAIIYHFCVYFLFNFFLFFSVSGNRKPNKYLILVVFLSSLIYALVDEIHQSFVPLRSSSIEDIFVDLIGITSSMIIAVFISRKINQ